jgi:hypothetical protein
MPDSRISPKVIFCWRVASGVAHDSADRAAREAATDWAFQQRAHKARGAAVEAKITHRCRYRAAASAYGEHTVWACSNSPRIVVARTFAESMIRAARRFSRLSRQWRTKAADALVKTMAPTMAVAIKASSTLVMRHTP